jgi:hypothetical protein
MMRYKYLFILLLTSLLWSCKGEETLEPVSIADNKSTPELRLPGCFNCHTDISLDKQHRFPCTECHRGDNGTATKADAHIGLVAKPASPENMVVTCGKCHPEHVQRCRDSLHFSLKKAVNLTRKHFGAESQLQALTQIPTEEKNSRLALVDDMLRRRCLRCHLYSSGDDYPNITRGQGCAACHLQFVNGTLKSHSFLKTPGDWQCISCHYANHVGADYYGQYEHDFNWEYRTPYTTKKEFFRPYGVELHDLTPDIHQQKGLSCIDCHPGSSLKADMNTLTCSSCHAWKPGEKKPEIKKISINDDVLILTDRSGKKHTIPSIQHPAHENYGREVSCQVCHAQWAFNDSTTHLLRSANDEYDFQERLTVQSSSWVEHLLEHNINSLEDEIDPIMADGITGRFYAGVWYKGYTQRRWEKPIIKRDVDGVIKVFRPILDLRLSAVDEKGEVLFDNLMGNGSGLLPYTPHTTGPAGLFYRDRFLHLLESEISKETKP